MCAARLQGRLKEAGSRLFRRLTSQQPRKTVITSATTYKLSAEV